MEKREREEGRTNRGLFSGGDCTALRLRYHNKKIQAYTTKECCLLSGRGVRPRREGDVSRLIVFVELCLFATTKYRGPPFGVRPRCVCVCWLSNAFSPSPAEVPEQTCGVPPNPEAAKEDIASTVPEVKGGERGYFYWQPNDSREGMGGP